jgi:hypothetical protein
MTGEQLKIWNEETKAYLDAQYSIREARKMEYDVEIDNTNIYIVSM